MCTSSCAASKSSTKPGIRSSSSVAAQASRSCKYPRKSRATLRSSGDNASIRARASRLRLVAPNPFRCRRAASGALPLDVGRIFRTFGFRPATLAVERSIVSLARKYRRDCSVVSSKRRGARRHARLNRAHVHLDWEYSSVPAVDPDVFACEDRVKLDFRRFGASYRRGPRVLGNRKRDAASKS